MSGNGAGTPALPAILQAALAVDADLQALFDERAGILEYDGGLSRAEAEARAAAEIRPRIQALKRQLAPLPSGSGLELWRAGMARLSPHQRPCPGYRAGEWIDVHENALAFLDTFSEEAERLGWTTAELFGVHPSLGTTRVDHCGALVLSVGGRVRLLTADEIRFERLTYRRKTGQPQGAPIWEFVPETIVKPAAPLRLIDIDCESEPLF